MSLTEKAESLTNLGNFEETLVSFESALRINSRHITPLRGKATMLKMLGAGKEALYYYDKLLAIDDDSIEPYLKKTFTSILKNGIKKRI